MKKLPLGDKIVFIINLGFAFLLLMSCIYQYLPIEHFPLLRLLSFAVSLLGMINLLFLGYWLLRKKRQFMVSLIALFITYLFFGSYFKFGWSKPEFPEKELSVMSFNTRGFNKFGWIENMDVEGEIINFVKENNPDVLCIQEFNRLTKQKIEHYPYKFVTPYPSTNSAQATFSRYPIVDQGVFDFPGSINSGIFIDILYKNDTIRVYNLHLESFKVPVQKEYLLHEPAYDIIKRMGRSLRRQYEQATIVREHFGTTKHPRLVCGDFNATQFSETYDIIKGDMTDTFLEEGSAFGRTYDLLGFPMRIDYILVEQGIEVGAHKNFDLILSDHFPLMVSVRLPE